MSETRSVLDRIASATGIPAIHIVGPITGFAVGQAIVVPRGTWLALLVIFGLMALARPLPVLWTTRHWRTETVTAAFMVFATWTMASALWSAAPWTSFFTGCAVVAAVIAAHLATSYAVSTNRELSEAAAIGFLAGMCITGMLLVIDLWTHQAIGRAVVNFLPWLQKSGTHMAIVAGQVVAIDAAESNRRVCVWSLLLWPSVAALWVLVNGRVRLAIGLVMLFEIVLIVVGTEHQSSQLAFVAGAIALGLYAAAPRAAVPMIVSGWVAAMLFVVPITAAAYDSGLSNAPWLFYSARERVAIWGYTAHNVGKHVLLGIGADATPAVDDSRHSNTDTASGGEPGPFVAHRPGRHSHNVFLQVWYELGFVGAMLFLAAGLATIAASRRFAHPLRGLQLANLAGAAAMVSTSYGMWQTWVQIAVITSAVFMLLIANISQKS